MHKLHKCPFYKGFKHLTRIFILTDFEKRGVILVKHTTEYDRYMRSDAWSRKRAERLELDDNKCVMCGRNNGLRKDGKTPILQVHHIHYSNLGVEPMEDLVSLCAGCHRKIHRYYKRKRNWND